MTTTIASLVAGNLDLWTSATQRKSGAGRGGGKRISLYGIERLRALILDLAVRGKLVPQDAGDEPAAELLLRSAKAVKASVELERFRAPTKILPSKSSEALPDSWVATRLGALVRVINGRAYKKPELLPSGTPVLRVGNLFTSNDWYYSDLDLDEDKYIDDGDLIYAWSASFGPFIWTGGRVIYHYHIWKLEPYSEPDASRDFLRLFLANETAAIKASGHGIAMLHMTKERMEQLPLPLPPLAEQRRIVAKVDELMALCDALERESADAMAAHQALVEALLSSLVNSADAAALATNWARLEQHFDTLFTTEASIDALKQSILDLAVRGKLVEQDRQGGWIDFQLGKIIGPMDSGWSPACLSFPARTDEVWGVLKTTAVQNLEYLPEENKELPEKLQPRPAAECRAGDILITRAGPTNRVGICCYVPATRPRLMISDKIVRFRPASDQIDGAFLALALSVGPSAAQIEVAKSGMAASQVNISQAKLREVTVSLPPLAEQQRIVAKVDALMAHCDALKARITDAATTQKHLADAITERAAA